MSDVLQELYSQYPGLQKYGVQVVDSTAKGVDWRGQPYAGRKMEFYPPDEEYNPRPGKPTIELFSRDIGSKDALGEMFSHFLPKIDPAFGAAREKFVASIDPEQKKMLSGDYQEQIRSGVYPKGREPGFDQWLKTNGGDAFFRGYVADQYPKEFYRPDQVAAFAPLISALQTPQASKMAGSSPELDRLQKALIAADDAGDVEGARALAGALRSAMANTQRQQIIQSTPSEYDPNNPLYQQQYGATSSMGTGSRLAAGAGKAFADIGRGVKQLTGNMPSAQVDETKALDAPLMRTPAGIVGNIGGNAALAAPTMFIPGVNTYTGAGLVGAGMGALQPVGTQDSRALNMGLGAAGGMGGRFVGNRIANWAARSPPAPAAAGGNAQAGAQAAATAQITPGQAGAQTTVTATPQARMTGGGPTFGTVGEDASAGLTAAQRQVMQQGQALGMRVTPGQATGSRALQQFEAKLESQPMTSGPFNAIRANNAGVVNRAAARAIGETGNSVDSTVLDRAAQRIGAVFEDAGDDVARAIDPGQFLQNYQTIQADVRGLVNGFDRHPLVEDLTRFAEQGTATGEQLQSLTSKLGKAAYKNMTTPSGDRDLGMALYQVKDYVDELLQQGMSRARAQTFQEARTQYRNLMLLTSRTSVVNPSTGNVSGSSLANVLQLKDRSGFAYGRNASDMYNAARFAQAFKPIVGDSGTATRMPFTGAMDFALRLPMNIATRMYTSTPGINMALGAQAGANAASRAMGPMSQAARSGLGSAPFYAPYLLPGIGGLMGADVAAQ